MSLFDIPKGYETKMRIVAAMVKLGETATFDELTVEGICQEVAVSRQTFYNHFADKYAAAEWYNNQVSRDFYNQESEQMLFGEITLDMLRRVYEERDFYRLILATSDTYYSPIHTIPRDQYRDLRNRVERISGAPITPKLDFQLRAVTYLGTTMVAEWLRDGCSTPVEEYHSYMTSCVPSELKEILNPR